MNYRKYILLVTLLLATLPLWSQTPTPDPDTVSNPIQQGDPALHTLPPRLDYVENRKRIKPEEVPQPVRQTLQSHAQYDDWRDAKIYYDENVEEYVLEFSDASPTKTYRFNKDGKQILEE